MFNPLSNTLCNHSANAAFTINHMDMTMQRLYQFIRDYWKISGQSAVARELNESPQTLNNWESRKISAEGAIKAQYTFGCNAFWVMTGEGNPSVTPGLEREEVDLLKSFRAIGPDASKEQLLKIVKTFVPESSDTKSDGNSAAGQVPAA